jgi:hypothetical protein
MNRAGGTIHVLEPGSKAKVFGVPDSILQIVRKVQAQNTAIIRQNDLLLRVIGCPIVFIRPPKTAAEGSVIL